MSEHCQSLLDEMASVLAKNKRLQSLVKDLDASCCGVRTVARIVVQVSGRVCVSGGSGGLKNTIIT
jgi:hypothetical protein